MEKPPNLDQITESEPLKKHGLVFVGAGAEKICFKTAGSDKKLIKVSRYVLRRKVFEIMNGKTDHLLSVHENEKKSIKEYKEQEDALSEVFGTEHVLKNGVFRYSVPITKEVALAVLKEGEKGILDRFDDHASVEVKMLIETQPLAAELDDKEKYKTQSLNAPLLTYDVYTSKDKISERLAEIERCVGRELDEQYLEWEKSGFVDVVRTIVEGIITYSKKTGLIVDIFGHDNITIYVGDDGKINFHLLDPVLPVSRDFWNKNINDDEKLTLLRHYYTYYYAVNYLIDKLDIDQTLFPEDLVYFKGVGIPTDGMFPLENEE